MLHTISRFLLFPLTFLIYKSTTFSPYLSTIYNVLRLKTYLQEFLKIIVDSTSNIGSNLRSTKRLGPPREEKWYPLKNIHPPKKKYYCCISSITFHNHHSHKKITQCDPSGSSYRVFIWNLGKLTVYYRGLYSVIWAKHISIFRHNTNITDISGSNWLFSTLSPIE